MRVIHFEFHMHQTTSLDGDTEPLYFPIGGRFMPHRLVQPYVSRMAQNGANGMNNRTHIYTQALRQEIIRISNGWRILHSSEIENMHMISPIAMVIWAMMLATVMAGCGLKGKETGNLTLTEEQHEDFYCEDTIALAVEKLTSDGHQYRALYTIDDATVFQPPHVDCWAQFNKYMAKNLPLFKRWANKFCRDYRGCWCCPGGGLCVAFVVKPTSPPCYKWADPIYAESLAVFEA